MPSGQFDSVTPFLLYLLVLAALGPLQFGYHLVSPNQSFSEPRFDIC